jgi:hypothetical protein
MAQFYYASSLSKNIDMTPEGFLICKDVAITRAGDFFYLADEVAIQPDSTGMVRMIRSLEEIVSQETIASFEGKPLTLLHPDDAEVNPNNYADVTVGTVQNVRRGTGADMDKLIADLLIMEKNAIAAVMNKEMREVSVGFSADQIQISPGIGIQEGIRGNHVAIVPVGRAGHDFAIKDSLTIRENGSMGLKDKILKSFGKALDEALPKEVEQATEDESKSTELLALGERLNALEQSITKIASAIPDQLEKLMAAKNASQDAANDKSHQHDSRTLSMAEILAPGIDHDVADLEMAALKASYKTEHGKQVIDAMLAGKELNTISKDAGLKRTIFVAASEIVKAKRDFDMGSGFADNASLAATSAKAAPKKMTPEEYNRKHDQMYNKGVK